MVAQTQASSADRSVVAALDEWLAGLSIGEPLSWGPLALFPLFYASEASERGPAYVPLEQALATGQVVVSELMQAAVPTLELTNLRGMPVLLTDGDEVVGGQQNRVVNISLLVPPATKFPLPVSCIEHGRWYGASRTFSAGEAVYPTLRRRKTEQVSASMATTGAPMADQGAVWSEIAERHGRHGVRSETGALRDAYLQREHLLTSAQRLEYPAGGPVGVLAALSGRALCADVFDRASTLRAYWPRLVRAYALEALEIAPTGRGAATVVRAHSSARRLLSRARAARRSCFPSPGLGSDIRLSGSGIVGAALVHERVPVHTAVFRRPGVPNVYPGA